MAYKFSQLQTLFQTLFLNGMNIVLDPVMERKWIGHARLLEEVPSTIIEYCKVYKIPKELDPCRSLCPVVPGPIVYTYLKLRERQLLV